VRAESRAPAKAIVVGEHFVVYGGNALAVSLDLWARASAERGPSLIIESEDPPGTCGDGDCAPHLRPLRAMLEDVVVDHPRAVGRYRLSSGIPQARGLGSSAAAAVSLAAAALALAEGDAPRDDVYRYAMVSERIVHGNPSGIDPAASTYGGAILYSRSAGIRRLAVGGGELLICCGPSPRSTYAMIERVAGFRESRAGLFDALTATSSDLAAAAARALESGDARSLAPIVRWHQGALRILGASSAELEECISRMESGGYAAKLTGAGGGGCAIGVPTGRTADVRCSAASCMRLRYPSGGVEAWVSR